MAIYYEDQTEEWKEEFIKVIKLGLDPTYLLEKAKKRKRVENGSSED